MIPGQLGYPVGTLQQKEVRDESDRQCSAPTLARCEPDYA